jgi:hypothetical protein
VAVDAILNLVSDDAQIGQMCILDRGADRRIRDIDDVELSARRGTSSTAVETKWIGSKL